jgi:hypothetical protein
VYIGCSSQGKIDYPGRKPAMSAGLALVSTINWSATGIIRIG